MPVAWTLLINAGIFPTLDILIDVTFISWIPGPVAQLVVSLTADLEVSSSIPAQSHTT